MKRMISKYPGTCCECSKPIAIGVPIRFFGRGRAAHGNCYNVEGKTEGEIASEYRGKCWECDSLEGKFRRLGAATPVWCDACFDELRHDQDYNTPGEYDEDEAAGFEPGTLASDRRLAKQGLTVIRTSGGSWTQNSRGRCEDAPCCGCCS